ncbi:MAG: glutaredoxin family protein [Anaerolineae bacterium]
MESYVKHVEGKKVADVFLYALSTCVWCRKTKALLNELGVEYDYVDVDLLAGDDRQKVMTEVQRWNPSRSFPTIVINNDKAIVGFDELKVKNAVGEQG